MLKKNQIIKIQFTNSLLFSIFYSTIIFYSLVLLFSSLQWTINFETIYFLDRKTTKRIILSGTNNFVEKKYENRTIKKIKLKNIN